MSKYILAVFLGMYSILSSAATEITMNSDQGDYIGAGQTYSFSESVGSFTVSQSANLITIRYSDSSNNFTYNFYSPDDLQPGSYIGALRYPFQGPTNPGLSVSGNGRGCNTLTGHFVVYELSVLNGVVDNLAIDFEQHCEGFAAALRGSVRINSQLASPSPAPVAIAGNDFSVAESSLVTLDGQDSFVAAGEITTYLWQQTSGTPVEITGSNSPVMSFVAADKVALGGTDLAFSLMVSDSAGNQATDSIVVHVSSKSDPKTFMSFVSEPGDYIGGGSNWYYSENDAIFTLTTNYDNGIAVRVSAGESWNLDFAAAGDVPLTTGIYTDATRFPFQPVTSNGLSVSGNGRGCNTLTGQFEVLSLSSLNGSPEQFSATFEQHCEGGTAALFGEIYVNALDKSVPIADAGEDQLVKENTQVVLDATASSDSDGSIVQYHWTQTSGTPVVLTGGLTAQPYFNAPVLGDRVLSSAMSFHLLVEDDLGFMSESTVSLIVEENNLAPVANDLTVKVTKNSVNTIDVIANDIDSDGIIDAGSVVILQNPLHGVLNINSDGTVVYTPDYKYSGADSFSYTVTDNDGAVSNVANVIIDVSKRRWRI